MFRINRNKEDLYNGSALAVTPLLPLRDIVVFPLMVVPLFVGRDKSVNALEKAMSSDKKIFLSAQTKAKTDTPTEGDIYRLGTVANILQILRLPDGTVKVLVEGDCRARVMSFVPHADYFLVQIEPLQERSGETVEIEALRRGIRATFETYSRHNKKITQEVLLIRKGKLRVDFFDSNRQYQESAVLQTGDIILLASGGHGFEMLEETEMIEIKQGPYAGEDDKTRFNAEISTFIIK